MNFSTSIGLNPTVAHERDGLAFEQIRPGDEGKIKRIFHPLSLRS
jgi:hypothetical protein